MPALGAGIHVFFDGKIKNVDGPLDGKTSPALEDRYPVVI